MTQTYFRSTRGGKVQLNLTTLAEWGEIEDEDLERLVSDLDESGNAWLTIPGVTEVCPRCNGRGVHDPEAFESGFTADDMAEAGPEFVEDYLHGVYDVPCTECGGANVVHVPAWDTINADSHGDATHDEVKRLANALENARTSELQERAHERRLRSMGIEY